MSIYLLPVTSDDPHFQFLTRLEDVACRFEFLWNARDGYWQFALIGEDDGEPYFGFLRVVLGLDLLERCQDPRRPPGGLVAIDTSNSSEEAGEQDLGNRVVLYYVTSDQIPVG